MLVLCSACRRHVRSEEARCPFCRTIREGTPVPAFTIGPRSRAALAAGLVTLAGCGKLGSSDDRGAVQAAYGAPPPPPTQVAPSATHAPSTPQPTLDRAPDASAEAGAAAPDAAKPK